MCETGNTSNENDYATCAICDEKFAESELNFITFHSLYSPICESCFSELYYCEHCEEYIEDEINEVVISRYDNTTQQWCNMCVNVDTWECEHCEKIYSNSVGVGGYSNGSAICNSCIADDYFYCNGCDEYLLDENYMSDGLCESCYRKENDSENIHDYGYNPYRFNFLMSGDDKKPRNKTLFFGLELEVESKSDKYDASESVLYYSNDESKFYLKEDGSLDDGFELVTMPATLNYHIKKFGWNEICESLSNHDCISHNATTCGLHVHVSRCVLSETDQIKIAYFLNSNIEFYEVIARRSSQYYARACDKKLKRGQNYSDSRYEVVNFENDKTIEFRLFKGTLKHETILATIQFLNLLIAWVKKTSCVKMVNKTDALQSFKKYILENKKENSYLIEYLKQRKINL